MPDQDAGRSGPSATQPWTAQEISAPAQLPPTLPGEPGPDDQADDDAAANEHPRDVMSWLARGASSTC